MPAIDDAVIGDRFNEFSVSDNERALIHPVLDLQNRYGLDVWCINHRNQIRFGRKDLRGKNTYLVGLINLANQQFVINGAYQTNTLMNALRRRLTPELDRQGFEGLSSLSPGGSLRIETSSNEQILAAILSALEPVYRDHTMNDDIFYPREGSLAYWPEDYDAGHSPQHDVLEIIRRRDIDETQKARLIKARLGQGAFRASLDRIWNYECALTGCGIRQVLRASHIKPWADSTDVERLDENNGILMSAFADALFDSGLISFSDQGEIMYTNGLNHDEVARHGLGHKLRGQLNDKQIEYLQWHRNNVFNQPIEGRPAD